MKNRSICKTLVTLGPLGLLPAPGTCATVLTIPMAYALACTGFYAAGVLAITLLAFCAITCALPLFVRKDPQEIVLDEVVGCLWVLYAAHWSLSYVLSAFLLFRFFDITKLFGIRFFERLPGAWGILADDCVAALYTYMILCMGRFFLC